RAQLKDAFQRPLYDFLVVVAELAADPVQPRIVSRCCTRKRGREPDQKERPSHMCHDDVSPMSDDTTAIPLAPCVTALAGSRLRSRDRSALRRTTPPTRHPTSDCWSRRP